MSYRIELVAPSGDTATIVDDDIYDLDVVRPHTALADFKATIPYSAKAIRDWVTTVVEARISYDGELLFRGYLESADSNERDGTTTLEGRGIGRDLKDLETSIRFTDTETHVAIQQVWDLSDFDATVYNPSGIGSTNQDGQNATTTAEFENILSTPATSPFDIAGDQVQPHKTAWTTEAENYDGQTDTSDPGHAEFSGGSGVRLDADGESAYWDFTPQHDVPVDDVQLWVREYSASGTGNVRIYFGTPGDLSQIDNIRDTKDAIDRSWRDYANNPRNGTGYQDGDLQAGTTYRFFIEAGPTGGTNDGYDIDVVSPLDALTRYDPTPTYTFDNDNGGNSGYLDGPEYFPTNGVPLDFQIIDDDDNIDAADLVTTWDDTSNGQAVKLSNDGGGSFPLTASNATDLSGDFTTTYGSRLQFRAVIASYGSRSTATPQQGYQFQAIQSMDLDYESSPVNVIEDKTFSGSLLNILQKLHKKAGYRFAIDHGAMDGNGDPTKVVESFEQGDQTRQADFVVNNRNPTRDLEDYANRVTVYGALLDDGTRPSATVQDDAEIAALGGDPDGVRHVTLVRPDMTTLDDVRAEARSELGSRVSERKDTGSLDIQPANVLPGYDYDVDWYGDGNPTATPNEKVQFTAGYQKASGRLQFTRDRGTAFALVQARYAQSITEDAI
jgi:hypothetical protein